MPREARILAGIIISLLAISLLGFNLWRRSQSLARLATELAQTREVAQSALANASSNLHLWSLSTAAVLAAQHRIESLEQEKAELAREKEAIAERQRTLETEMRQALESKDVTISELQGRLTVDILDRVLFDSGEATLKPEGESVLQRVAGVLAQFPGRQVHVIGHTDNVPIRAGSRTRFASNWELSAARALAAVRFLTERAGVAPQRLGAVGYGEFRPVADNATPEGRARNRRIALVVLSEELAGSDLAGTVRPVVPGPTNAPPPLPEIPPATNTFFPPAPVTVPGP